MVQAIRRTLQVTVLTFMVVAPVLGLYDILIENYRIQQVVGSTWQGIFYWVDNTVRSISSSPERFADNFKGSTWSLSLWGFNITDPLAFVGILASGGGFYLDLFISILPLVILTVLLGRVFCGWLCPMHLIFELNGKIRGILGWLGIRPLNISFGRVNKYVILVVGCLFSMALGIQFFTFIYPPAILNRELIHLIYFGSVGVGIVSLGFVMFMEVSLSQRVWCRSFCPGGALWSLLGVWRVVTVVRDPALCDNCGDCDRACEFGLSPMKDEVTMECDNCGRCIAHCGRNGLAYAFSLPWRRRNIISSTEKDRKPRLKLISKK